MDLFFGLLMCVLLNISQIPQIHHTLKTKSVKDLSRDSYFFAVTGFMTALLFCWVTQSSWWLVLNYATGLVFSLTMLILIYRYRK